MAGKYWAAIQEAEADGTATAKDSARVGQEVMARVEDYFKQIQQSGWLGLWQRLWTAYYYGTSVTKGTILRVGEQGELASIGANHFGSLLQRKLVMTAGQKLNLEARAMNTDYGAQAKTVVGNGLLEECQEKKGLD